MLGRHRSPARSEKPGISFGTGSPAGDRSRSVAARISGFFEGPFQILDLPLDRIQVGIQIERAAETIQRRQPSPSSR